MRKRKLLSFMLACIGIFNLAVQSTLADASGTTDKFGLSFDDAVIAKENAEYDVQIEKEGQYVYYEFVPNFTGEYRFYTKSDKDTCGYLYNGERTLLKNDDDSGDGENFKITYNLTSGETYYIVSRLGKGTGAYTLVLETDVTGSTKTVCVTSSDGDKIFVTIPDNIPKDATIILACYNEEAITEVKTAPNKNETIYFVTTKEFDEVKVMAWDSLNGMVPVSKNAETLYFKEIENFEDKKVTTDAGLFDSENYTEESVFNADGTVKDGAYFDFYDSRDKETTTRYLLNTNVKLYVNDEEVDFTPEAVEKYIIDSNVGSVVLVDINRSKKNSADGLYDYIYVEYTEPGTVTLDLSLFDEEEYVATEVFDDDGAVKTGAGLYFFDSEDAARSAKYELDENVKLYVNGVEVAFDNTTAKGMIEKYVVNNKAGAIKLVDVDNGSALDGKYDCIYADYFATAKVDAVNSKKITFADKVNIDRASLTLDKENNEGLEYHIYYNDEEIAITDLKMDDILSIAYDVTATSTDKSKFFEIYVSRDVQTGEMNGQDDEDETVTIGSEEYAFVKSYSSMKYSMTLGSKYTIRLDIFGRIFSSVSAADGSENLAILDKYYSNSSYDNNVGQFFFPDGTTKVLEIENARVGLSENVITALVYYVALDSADWTNPRNMYFVSNVNRNKTPIENRVVEYGISSANKIVSLEFLNPVLDVRYCGDTYTNYCLPVENSYSERTNSLGIVKMNSDTKIIDATEYYKEWYKGEAADYGDLVKGSLADTFIDGVEYVAMGFGYKNSDGTYPLVLVLERQGAYTEKTKLGVVSGSLAERLNDAGDEGYKFKMYYDGEATTRFVSDDAIVNGTCVTENNYSKILQKGDVIAFQVNSKGDIDEIDVVFAADTIDLGKGYSKTVSKSFSAMSTDFAGMIALPADAKYWTAYWDDKSSSDYSTSLVYGVVTDKRGDYFQLGKVAKGTVDSYTGLYTNLDANVNRDGDSSVGGTAMNNGGVMDISLTDATKVYVFDYSQSRKDNMLYEGTKSDIIATSIPSSHITTAGGGYEYIFWDKTVETKTDSTGATVNVSLKEANDIYFAFAKVVDGVATDVLVIYAE